MAEIRNGRIVTDKRKFPGKAAAVIIAVFAIAVFAALSFKIVPAGSTGVSITMGKVSDYVLSEGIHFKIPFVQKIEVISNKIQNEEVEVQAVSKDLQSVSSKIAINFRVGLDSSAQIFKNIGRDYSSVILLPAVQESMKAVSAKYTAEELISKRTQVSEEIKMTLESKVNAYGIIIERFNIVNFDFSSEFNAAIEAKQVAEQNLIKTKTEQEQQIIIAESEARKRIIAAQAEADSITAKAEAQAAANALLSQSLNEILVEYEKIQKWDGILPKVSGDGSTIIDMRE